MLHTSISSKQYVLFGTKTFKCKYSHLKKLILHLKLVWCAPNKIISTNIDVYDWIHPGWVVAHHQSWTVMDPKHTNRKNLLVYNYVIPRQCKGQLYNHCTLLHHYYVLTPDFSIFSLMFLASAKKAYMERSITLVVIQCKNAQLKIDTSSMLMQPLALVSINLMPCSFANSLPLSLLTTRESDKSHLLPSSIFSIFAGAFCKHQTKI